jgi:hypothetical protein
LGAHRRPRGHRSGEEILDDPLPERFADHRGLVADAGAAFEVGDVIVGGCRDESVDDR